jgi:hypothetical protein
MSRRGYVNRPMRGAIEAQMIEAKRPAPKE